MLRMNLNKEYFNYLNLIIASTFVTGILIISSTTELSFAKKDDENKEGNKDIENDISVSSINKIKKTHNGDLKELDVQNDVLNSIYPNQFYICGYPQQIITDYNSFEKVNCN
jgi:hypothetical protein